MEIKFDATTAEQLISEMDEYCSSIQKEATDVLDILEFSGDWNDGQMRKFQGAIMEISKDLCDALRLESEYMRYFKDRVEELRG